MFVTKRKYDELKSRYDFALERQNELQRNIDQLSGISASHKRNSVDNAKRYAVAVEHIRLLIGRLRAATHTLKESNKSILSKEARASLYSILNETHQAPAYIANFVPSIHEINTGIDVSASRPSADELK